MDILIDLCKLLNVESTNSTSFLLTSKSASNGIIITKGNILVIDDA